MKFPSGSDIIKSLVPLTTLWKRIDVSQVGTTSIQVATNPGQVLDLMDNNFANGNGLQVWQDYKASNQLVKLKDGRIVFGSNKCVDVPDGRVGNGVLPQIWDCSDNNPNQWWQIHYDTGGIEYRDSGYYLNVRDGRSSNGGRIQLWQYNPYDPNFKFQITTVAQSNGNNNNNNNNGNWAITGAQNWLGMNVISFDDMCNRFPQVNRYRDAISRAAADQNIHATFLAAICLQESTCSPTSNGFGFYQFSDWNAWLKYGAGGNRDNIYDSSYGAARYYRDLLNLNNQNLNAAMGAYSGYWGGYIDGIYTWTSGYTPRSHQRRDSKETKSEGDFDVNKGLRDHKKQKIKAQH